MIVDTSAIIAILAGESEARRFATILARAPICRMSAASFVEAGIVTRRDRTGAARTALDNLVTKYKITIEPVSEHQARIALDAYDQFGKGTGHRAGLNYGDCFSYALSADMGEPLLFKGDDFSHTDLEIVG